MRKASHYSNALTVKVKINGRFLSALSVSLCHIQCIFAKRDSKSQLRQMSNQTVYFVTGTTQASQDPASYSRLAR